MAIYVYTPGNRATLQAETIGLVGASVGDVESERHALLNAGMNAVSRGKVHNKEVSGQLDKADPRRLPVELMSRLLDPEHYTTPVMNAKIGLAMYAPTEEGTANFALLSEEVEDVEELIAEDRLDRETFMHLPVREAITHDALQLELYVNDNEQLKVREHNSLGYLVEGVYLPVVTVLSGDHPVRQLIEQARQD
jgi:hypothetical protein